MKFNDRIKGLRLEKNLTKKEIVELIGIKYSTYANYESGIREPNSETLSILSNFFNVSIDYLLGLTNIKISNKNILHSEEETTLLYNFNKLNSSGKNEANKRIEELTHIPKYTENSKFIKPNFKKKVTKSEKIPFYEVSVSAGTGNWLENSTYEIVSVDRSIYPKADFILRISGDSMEPKYSNGDIVYVKEQHSIDNGKIGIFIYNNEAYIKKYEVREDGPYLTSLNKKYPPIKIDEYSTFKICGLIL